MATLQYPIQAQTQEQYQDESLDRLYELLPVIHRLRDAEQADAPLKGLLQIIAEQVSYVEADIAQLYENWFIETCDDWVVPYIGDLIGYTPLFDTGDLQNADPAELEARNKILIPRREVANTIRYRRRKGTLALLEELANNVADWPARAVEFYRLLAWMQHLNHQHPNRGRTVDLRDSNALDLLDGPFDTIAHTVDVRRINSHRTVGRYNIPSVGLFVWRLKSYPVTKTQARCIERAGDHCYTFSALGNNVQLYINPARETSDTQIAQESNVPAPIRRLALRSLDPVASLPRELSDDLEDNALVSPTLQQALGEQGIPLDAEDGYEYRIYTVEIGRRWIIKPKEINTSSSQATDAAGDNRYTVRTKIYTIRKQGDRLNVYPPKGVHASDALYGVHERDVVPSHPPCITTVSSEDPPDEIKSLALWVTGWRGSAVSSGTEEKPVPSRCIIPANLDKWKYQPPPGYIAVDPVLGRIAFHHKECPTKLRVSYHYGFSADIGGGEYYREQLQMPSGVDPTQFFVTEQSDTDGLNAKLIEWRNAKTPPSYAIIEIDHSDVYTCNQPIYFKQANQTLFLRAKQTDKRYSRPLIFIDDTINQPDALKVYLLPGCRLVLDGLLIADRPVQVERVGSKGEWAEGAQATLHIRHCTLVPGWSLHNDCRPVKPAGASLTVTDVDVCVKIEDSILGSIRIQQDDLDIAPIPLIIHNSIIDATRSDKSDHEQAALCADSAGYADAVLNVRNSTILGATMTHTIELGENTIFDGHVAVVRSQHGCLRFSYVPPDSRTPRRFNCQPDRAVQRLREAVEEKGATLSPDDPRIAAEQLRVRPLYNSITYGTAEYCQLAEACAEQITRGAEDTSEMGVFHDLYQPQRLANLRTRLDEFSPAGVDAGIIIAS